MADIARYPFARHLRGSSTTHVGHIRNGRTIRAGVGASFWFRPLSAVLHEVPVDDRELPLLFHARTSDFQDVTVQATITYRVTDPATAAGRIDFSIDPETGAWRSTPLDQVAGLLTESAQQYAIDMLATVDLTNAMAGGVGPVRSVITDGLRGDERLAETGIAVVGVRVVAVRPEPEVEKALRTPTRERVQQESDKATFERRAIAVERERAIGENELQTQIELARREEQLVEPARREHPPRGRGGRSSRRDRRRWRGAAHRDPRRGPRGGSPPGRRCRGRRRGGAGGGVPGRARGGPAGARPEGARGQPAHDRHARAESRPRQHGPGTAGERAGDVMSLTPRVVIVHRRTEYDELLATHGTRGQAAFFLSTRGRDIAELEERHRLTQQALETAAAAIPVDWRRGNVERADVSRFLFSPDDVIVVVGQDGLVANVAKYLDGQPVIGIDPEPGRNAGVLVTHAPADLGRPAAQHRPRRGPHDGPGQPRRRAGAPGPQ